jgi:beta-glucosidase
MGQFPERFLWGASTSSHQVEGNNLKNNWWEWEQTGEIEASGTACDHYNLFREDFRMAKELCHNANRMGLEWSRLEPEEGIWDQKEWDHYKEAIDELIRLNIEPIVTLNHFTVPLWFHTMNSWAADRSISLFARFAEKAVNELGSRVKYWITINEPHMLAFISYFYGDWTPKIKDSKKAFTILGNMLKSHAEAYKIMNETANRNALIKKPHIGLAKAVAAFHPCSNFSVRDRFAAHRRNKYHNHIFLLSACKGKLLIPGLKHEKLAVKDSVDFIGLNYYYRQFVHNTTKWQEDPLGGICTYGHKHKDQGKVTDMGWEIYPKGIYELLKDFTKYKKPLIITENGLATTDDTIRRCFIKDHLSWIQKAINENIDVFGYLHWSLLDNFEWAEGFSKRFGLIEVNYDTKERIIRDSAKYYAQIIKSGTI